MSLEPTDTDIYTDNQNPAIWREGSQVVFRLPPPEFPARCVYCGAAAVGPMRRKWLLYWPMKVRLLLALLVVSFSIFQGFGFIPRWQASCLMLSLVLFLWWLRPKVRIEIGLCRAHQTVRTIANSTFIVCIALIGVLWLTGADMAWAVLAFLGTIIVGIACEAKSPQLTSLSDNTAKISGCHERFVQQLHRYENL